MDTKKLRQKILDLAIHGKLVPQDPRDEPASVLLERIRAEKEQLIKEGKIKKSRKTSSSSDTPHYEQVPFEVPEGWVWCRLGDVNEIARGGSPRPIKDYLTDNPNGVNWIKIGDTTKDGKYINSVKERIKPEGVKKSRAVRKGDFLLTNSMSFGRPYILNVDGCIHDGWLVISPIGKAYLPDFLYYLLSSSFAFEQFATVASGGVVTNLNSDKVADTFYPLPPIPEQSRIVKEIEGWFTFIDLIEKGKANLHNTIQQAKNKILDLAIHGCLVPQDPNDEPAIELLKRTNPNFTPCDNAQYGKLPDRWCMTKLGDIGKWQSGGTPNRAHPEYYVGDIPWLKIADLQDGYVKACSEKISNEAICNSSAKLNPEGSIALAMYGSIGKLGILTFPAATNQAICVCSSFMGVEAKYLFFFLMSQRDEFVLKAGGGVQANISKEIIINHRIAIPPLPEQLRILEFNL